MLSYISLNKLFNIRFFLRKWTILSHSFKFSDFSVGKDVKPEIYKPTSTIGLPKEKLPVSASSFEDAKKLAAERVSFHSFFQILFHF